MKVTEIAIRYATGTPDSRRPEVPTIDVPAEAGERYAPPVDAEHVPLADRMPGERFAVAPALALIWEARGMVIKLVMVVPVATWPVAELAPPEARS